MGQQLVAIFLLFVGIGFGCVPHRNATMKSAYAIYVEHQEDLGPPSPPSAAWVYSQRNDQFVSDLRILVSSDPNPKDCLYCLGWFGDQRDLPTTLRYIRDPDPETARVALSAFGNLARRPFASANDAETWWNANRSLYEIRANGKE